MRSRFGRRTIVAATVVLRRLTQNEFTHLLLELDLPAEADQSGAVIARSNSLLRFAQDNPQHELDDGNLLWDTLVEKAAAQVRDPEPSSRAEPEDQVTFRRALARDGYTVEGGTLRRSLPDIAGLAAADDEVHALLQAHQFTTPLGHLEQAIGNHAAGDWASANAQFRTFIESLLDEIASRLVEPTRLATAGSSHARRALLAGLTPPFLFRELNEWSDKGAGYLNGLFIRLHPQGSHPGLSDDDDSTFRLQVVLITARLLLRRFQTRVNR